MHSSNSKPFGSPEIRNIIYNIQITRLTGDLRSHKSGYFKQMYRQAGDKEDVTPSK